MNSHSTRHLPASEAAPLLLDTTPAGDPAHPAPARTHRIDAVVFDCDGLLVDSESCWLDIVADALEDAGADADEAADYAGLTLADAAASFGERVGVSGPAAHEELCRRYEQRLAEGVAPMPGAVRLVERLAGTVPIAVASNGELAHVRMLLESAGLLDRFDTIVTADDVLRGKPAPDPYALAVERLGIMPAHALALDDTAVGCVSAEAAGLVVAGVNADAAVELEVELRFARLDEVAARLGFEPADELGGS